MKKYEWYVADVLDDGHNGIVTCWSEPDSFYLNADNRIVIGCASSLTKEQAQKICDAHNYEIEQVRNTAQPKTNND